MANPLAIRPPWLTHLNLSAADSSQSACPLRGCSEILITSIGLTDSMEELDNEQQLAKKDKNLYGVQITYQLFSIPSYITRLAFVRSLIYP